MIRRILLLALPVLVVTLGGCQLHAGAAAWVGDTRISRSAVEDLVDEAADDPVHGALVARNRGVMRLLAVQKLIQLELLRQTAAAEKLRVTAAEIDRFEVMIAMTPPSERNLDRLLPVRPVAEARAYETAVIQAASKDADGPQDAVARGLRLVQRTAADHPIQVNPRYGRFSVDRFGLVEAPDAAVVTSDSALTDGTTPLTSR